MAGFFTPTNTVQFIGRLGKEPKEIGKDRLAFSIGINEKKKDGKEETYWPDCYVSGQPGEYLKKYCGVGCLLIVTGKYVTWTSNDGTKRHGFDIININKIGDGKSGTKEGPPSAPNKRENKQSKEDDNDNDIPF